MEEAKKTGHPYQLVLTIVNRGSSDQVMEAARSAGARGGTVIYARRVGYEDVQNMLGFTLQPEKGDCGHSCAHSPKAAGDAGYQPGGRPENRLPGRSLFSARG